MNIKRIVKTFMAPKGITALDMDRNGTNFCVGTLDGFLISYDLRSLQSNEPVSAARIHDTVVNCVEYLRGDSLNEMPATPLSLNSSSSSHSMSSSSSTMHDGQTCSSKPPMIVYNNSHSSSASHLSSTNKLSTMSLYSPENSHHVMKPTMTKSFSSSGLMAAAGATRSNSSNMSGVENGIGNGCRSMQPVINENINSSFSSNSTGQFSNKNDSTLIGKFLNSNNLAKLVDLNLEIFVFS